MSRQDPYAEFKADPYADFKPGQRGSGSGRPQPVAPQDNPPSDYGLSKYLPSGRSLLQMGGSTVGGLVGSAGGPVGTIAGGGIGGAAADAAYQLGQRLRGKPDAFSGKDVGVAGLTGAGQEALGVAIPALARGAARSLYRNVLKPSTTLGAEEAAKLVETGLSERIPVSERGLSKVNKTISGINQDIDRTIASNPTGEVSPGAVARRVDPVVDDFKYKDLHKDLTAAEAEKARFVGEHSTPVQYSPYPPPHQPSLSFPVQPQTYAREVPILAPRAQAMKKAIWQELAPNDFGTVAAGYKQARKAIGTGLKEELQGLFPRIQGLNAREGNLLDLREPLSRAVNRIANRNTIGIDAPLVAGGMQAVTGKPALSVAAALAKTLPGSRTAIALNRFARPMGLGRFIAPYIADRFQAVNQ